MPVTIRIPTALRSFADDESKVPVDADTVGAAVAALVERYPDLREHLVTDEGELHSHVNVYVNSEDVRGLDGEATTLEDGDQVVLVPAVAGGARGLPVPPGDGLTSEETERYSRHLVLPDVGVEGQERLKNARVLVVGAGGLGSPLLQYLAAAGVGTIGLVDADVVDRSNLQRQVLYGESDVGRSKLEAAAERLQDINPEVEVEAHETYLTSDNALDILEGYDVVVDGTDNFPTRYLVNDACVLLGIPNVYGSIYRFEGQASIFNASSEEPCYRCLYPTPPPPGLVPSCAEGGVLGVLPGIVGCIQAIETIKLIIGEGDTLAGRLLLFDALEMEFTEMQLDRNPQCPACGDDPEVTELIDYEAFCGMPAFEESAEGRRGLQGPEPTPAASAAKAGEEEGIPEITAPQLAKRLEAASNGELQLVDVREPHEWDICHIEGAELIPLRKLPDHVDDLDRDAEIVVHCRSGGRSARAVEWLREEAGFRNVRNLQGGILAWSDEVDPSVPKY